MKLIAWNSNLKFREKIQFLLPLKADILVIPECESPEKWGTNNYKSHVEQFLWFGDNPNKGLGVLTLNDRYSMEIHPAYSDEYRYIVPLIVKGEEEFILFAVWTQNTEDSYVSYIGQLYLALQHYKELLNDTCIIAGDWNSSKNFDRKRRVGTHSETVKLLNQFQIFSTYHHYYNEQQGEESLATHYFWRKEERPFHIDYIFAKESLVQHLACVEVGKYQDWIKFSDHVPLIVDFKINNYS